MREGLVSCYSGMIWKVVEQVQVLILANGHLSVHLGVVAFIVLTLCHLCLSRVIVSSVTLLGSFWLSVNFMSWLISNWLLCCRICTKRQNFILCRWWIVGSRPRETVMLQWHYILENFWEVYTARKFVPLIFGCMAQVVLFGCSLAGWVIPGCG